MKKITLIGRTNAGKTTLLNKLTNLRVAVSEKSHTTREIFIGSVLGTSLTILDTPGINQQTSLLDKIMLGNLKKAIFASDLVWWIVEVGEKIEKEMKIILNILESEQKTFFLILNKIDLKSKEKLLLETQKWSENLNFDKLIPISALKGENLKVLIEETEKFFPKLDQKSENITNFSKIENNDKKKILKEIIREIILKKTKEEIPHQTALKVEQIEEQDGIFFVDCLVYVNSKSQKNIILRKKGLVAESERKIKNHLGSKAHLNLRIKIEKNWFKKTKILKTLDYEWKY